VVGAEVIAAQDIQFGVAGQVLILDCEDGRPASVTSVTVYGSTAGDASTPEVSDHRIGHRRGRRPTRRFPPRPAQASTRRR
jgi:hypothetical protein